MITHFDAALPRRQGQGAQAIVHLQKFGGPAIYHGGKALGPGHGNQHQPGLFQLDGGGKAAAVRRKFRAALSFSVGTVQGIFLIGDPPTLPVVQMAHKPGVLLRLLLVQHQRPHQQLGPVGLADAFKLLRGHITLHGKAHGHIVFIFQNGIAALGIVHGPALVGLFTECTELVRRAEHEPYAEQPPQRIVGKLGLGVYVPLHPHAGVKLQNGRLHGGVEELQTGPPAPQADVVVAFVGIQPVKALGQVQLCGLVIGLLHVILIPEPLVELGQLHMEKARHAGHAQHPGQQPPGEHAAGLCPPPDKPEHQQVDHAHGKPRPEQRLAVHLAQLPLAVHLGGHQGKQRKQRRKNQGGPVAPGQIHHVAVLKAQHRHQAHHQHRHIIPAGVIAGIEGVEAGVEQRHQRKHGAGA